MKLACYTSFHAEPERAHINERVSQNTVISFDVRYESSLCKNAVFWLGGLARIGEGGSCSDRFYQSADTQNAHYPFHVVGQDV